MTVDQFLKGKGLALAGRDIRDGTWEFRFGDEYYKLESLSMENKRPSRTIHVFNIPEIKYGMVAKIEEVRQAAKLEKENG